MYYRELPWSYAADYVLMLPDNTLYFKPNTPPVIMDRFEKDWANHLKRKAEREKQGIFFDEW